MVTDSDSNRFSSASHLLLHLILETRGELLGQLQVTAHISLGLQLICDLVSDPEVSHGCLDQPQTGLSERASQLGPSVLKPDLRERKTEGG